MGESTEDIAEKYQKSIVLSISMFEKKHYKLDSRSPF
jgi:hypothetical protein